jgi:two-component system, chemotaxis family, sensor kinase CheA
MAMTLDQVARLEEFPRSAIEQIADRLVVQFRGSIMPLVDIAELLSAPRDAARSFNLDDDSFQIVVHEHPKGRIGLLVGRILDIVDEAVAARTPPLRSGVLFNSVVGGFVTEFLDIDEILRRADHLLSPDGERSVA